jgi:predicted ATPase
LVELAALADGEFVPQTVGDAVGVRDQSAREPRAVLVDFLADMDMLLVLDSCEHVVDACAALVADLLRTAPRLRVIATSRQSLRVTGERLFEVRPLPVPDVGRAPLARPATRNEAVRLFADRAAIALPGFTVNAGNRAAVVRLCQRLEGIPLAIELAAVRVRAMPVEQILAQLEDYYLEALAAGSRVAVPRLQALRAAIDWSFDLCSEQEQRFWARASVFSGGFDLATAESVCSGAGIDPADVLGLVDGLVDKSVLIRSDSGQAIRFRMLESIREYGAERLAGSDQTAVRIRHRDHFGELAGWAERTLLGPDELRAFTRVWRDQANLRAALEFCLSEPGQARAGLEIASSLHHYWNNSGHHGEGRRWLDRALSLDAEPSPERAKALWVDGYFAFLQAERETGRSLVDQCRAEGARLGDEPALAHATRVLGLDALFHGDTRRAVTLLEEALARLRAVGDRTGTWLTLLGLALSTALVGDIDRARSFGEQCVRLADTPGAPVSRAWALALHGLGQWLAGDQRRATELVRDSLRVVPPFINPWGVAHCLEVLAWAAAQHDAERATRLLGAAHAVWRLTGAPPSQLQQLATEHARCVQRARAVLGQRSFGELFDRGAALTVDQAIAYALGDDA